MGVACLLLLRWPLGGSRPSLFHWGVRSFVSVDSDVSDDSL